MTRLDAIRARYAPSTWTPGDVLEHALSDIAALLVVAEAAQQLLVAPPVPMPHQEDCGIVSGRAWLNFRDALAPLLTDDGAGKEKGKT